MNVLCLLGLVVLLWQQRAHAQAGPWLGFHVSRGDAAHMEAAREAGGRFAVVVFSWADIEPVPNQLYWEKPDAALRAGQFHGVDVIARLDQPPDWALDAGSPSPWDAQAYANFARQVAARYGDRLAGLILWNEPNLSLEWQDQPPDAAGYVHLLRSAYPAVKAVAPDLPVLMAGLALTLGDGEQAVDDLAYLEAVYRAGGDAYFDALAAHPYGFGQPPEQAPAADRLNFRRLELQRKVMEGFGDEDVPIWISEMGWRTSAPSAAEAWQVVTPDQQADYTLRALSFAAENYPWLRGIGLWELKGGSDDYGYALWSGPEGITPAYEALVALAAAETTPDSRDSANPTQVPVTARAGRQEESSRVEILAPDVAIRLGDIGTLHPHWVHLYQSGQGPSLSWEGEFFLDPDRIEESYELVLETMQVDQPSNLLWVNGEEIARLATRSRPDQTSTWVTQRFPLPPGLLRPGVNMLRVSSGQRNPAHQYDYWRWENLQFRHARLVPATDHGRPMFAEWELLSSPAGWTEANRLRAGIDGSLWLIASRPGQLWHLDAQGLRSEAGHGDDLLFTDVLPTAKGLLATTDHGLVWRRWGWMTWQPLKDAPAVYSYVLAFMGDHYYAGFEGRGLWRAEQPEGPWQPVTLTRRTVLDLAVVSPQVLALATDSGVFLVRPGPTRTSWRRLGVFPSGLLRQTAPNQFVNRLYLGAEGELIARHEDRLWLWDEADWRWQPMGPSEVEGRELSVVGCCQPGMLVGSSRRGVWQWDGSRWQRLDDGYFDGVEATELISTADGLVAATNLGLFQSRDGQAWQPVSGLHPVVSDLTIAPKDPELWLAATPAGVYRSRDAGRRWTPVSPPWVVWDMAWGPQGRLFLARSAGLAWTDAVDAAELRWQVTQGMDDVLFFGVSPHPEQADVVWAGSWGNNVGVSTDGGASIEPLHNGLETLSALDVLWHSTPGQVTIATIEGLYRSDDGGRRWFKLPGSLAHQTVHRLLQLEDGAIWAGAADGLWSSRDYGASWQRVEDIPAAAILRLGRVASPAGDGTWLWAGTEGAGLWLSIDGGASWRFGGLEGRSLYRLLRHPTNSGRLLAATDRGIFAVNL